MRSLEPSQIFSLPASLNFTDNLSGHIREGTLCIEAGKQAFFFIIFYLQGPQSLSSPPPAAPCRRQKTAGIATHTPRLATLWAGQGEIHCSDVPLNSRERSNKRLEESGGKCKKRKRGDICVPVRFKCVLLGLSFLDPRLPLGVVSV